MKLLGHRYNDSDTGRFLTRDPIKDGRNWYSYCGNNPVSFFDADGLKEVVIVVGSTKQGYERGVQAVILDGLVKELEALGYAVSIVYEEFSTEDEVINALCDSDAFVYLGHGTYDPDGPLHGMPHDEDDAYLYDEDFRDRVMKKRKDKKFDFVWFCACYSWAHRKVWIIVVEKYLGYKGGVNQFNWWSPDKLKSPKSLLSVTSKRVLL